MAPYARKPLAIGIRCGIIGTSALNEVDMTYLIRTTTPQGQHTYSEQYDSLSDIQTLVDKRNAEMAGTSTVMLQHVTEEGVVFMKPVAKVVLQVIPLEAPQAPKEDEPAPIPTLDQLHTDE